ncbi:MAG TPA: type VI immunity family protein [Archangium sp.]|uniref:type VI immunity family protein n=1 Tax=Archangium sp. TaxID=1872627 RepID=UPI002E2FBAD3|nr:type VI immunity family protein [Archangium sp.]HEX5750750.1 type VI immunity family protein [Archangium sp.]
MRYPRLRHYSEHGRLVASGALLMTFYMQHPNERIAPAVLRALQIIREWIHPHQLAWYDAGEGQLDPLDDSGWERLRMRTLKPEPDMSAYLVLDGQSTEVDDLRVHYRGLDVWPSPWPEQKDGVSVLYVRLPTAFLVERGADRVRALALELAAELPFNSGYVDFVLCSDGWHFGEALPLIQPRYPGVHLASSRASLRMNTWVDGVHWMNFLGEPVLGKLGGVPGLRAHLGLPGITLQEMRGDRVLITLGAQPEVGDVEAGQTLPLHRALARILAPYLYRSDMDDFYPATEDMLRWERRFLD